MGVLELVDDDLTRLNPGQRRFLTALAYYAALAVERVRLSDEAGRAEVLREADRLKDALIASVSHDLRTPLTTIKALAHELRASGDDRAVIIEEEADRLNRLVGRSARPLPPAGGRRAAPSRAHRGGRSGGHAGPAGVRRAPGPGAQGRDRGRHPAGRPVRPGRTHSGFWSTWSRMPTSTRRPTHPSSCGSPRRRRHRLRRQRSRTRRTGRPAGSGSSSPSTGPPAARPDVGGAGLGLTIARRLAEAQAGNASVRSPPGRAAASSPSACRRPSCRATELL